MSRDCLLTTHHFVEYVRKGRRLVERAPFRLDVACQIAKVSRSDLVEAFVHESDGTKPRLVLYGYDGRLWRKAGRPADSRWDLEAELKRGKDLDPPHLSIGVAIDPAMIEPDRKTSAPLEVFDDLSARIVSDDRYSRIAAATRAASKVMLVDSELWVQVREPEWLVRKRGGDAEVMLMVDIHTHWRPFIVRDNMRFRLDRLPQAQAWARGVRGGRVDGVAAQRTLTETQADIIAGPWNVSHVDFAFFSADDVVAFALGHLKRTVETCAEFIEILPERLRRRWEELRIILDNIHGDGARAAAEAGLVLVEGTLAMLMEVRDVPFHQRARLVRQITRLRQNDRRTYLIEGLQQPVVQPTEIDDADLAVLAP